MPPIHLPGWAIFLMALGLFAFVVLMAVKMSHNAPVVDESAPSSDRVEEEEGGVRSRIEQHDRKASKTGMMVFVVIAVLACLVFAAAPKAAAIKGALWPSPTPTASVTPTTTPTRTPKPTQRFTLTPRNSPTPSATQTPMTTPTARIIYQSSGQTIVTQIVNHDVLRTVIVPVTVIVFQTVVVTPTDTPSATATETSTATATETPTATATETATPG